MIAVTAFHQRPGISAVYWAGITRLRQTLDLPVVAICTIGDDANVTLAEQHHATVVVAANRPMGPKWNKGFAAVRPHQEILKLDSDDLLSVAMVEVLRSSRGEVVGPRDCYVHDVRTRATVHWPGYETGHRPIGSGRLFRRRALHALGYAPWPASRKKTGYDSMLDIRLSQVGIVPHSVAMTHEAWFLALKSPENLWPASTLPGLPVLRPELSDAEVALLEAL